MKRDHVREKPLIFEMSADFSDRTRIGIPLQIPEVGTFEHEADVLYHPSSSLKICSVGEIFLFTAEK